MAFLNETFSVNDLPQPTSGEFSNIPDGWYSAKISSAELRNTKDGSGKYIALRFDITGPTHQGRVIFGNLNIRNKSEKAEGIGREDLGKIMRAIGLATVQDSDQLIGGNLNIKVGLSKPQDGYEQKNEPKDYKALNGAAPQAQAFSAQQASGQPSPQAASAAPPWAKK